MNNQSNLKRSYIEMADAADHLSSPINHFHSSSSNDMVEPQTDDACIQPQPQLQQQQQQQHIALPPLVEDLLNQLCNERKQPQPNYDVRRRLGLLGEEKALQLLHEINKAKVIKTLSGFIMWMIRNKPQYQCPSPSKYCPASLLQTQLSASPFTPSVHKEQPVRDHGGLRPRYSYSSASPSKALRVSPYQGPSYAPPSTITPVQLFKDALPLPQPFTQEMFAGWFSQPCSEIEDRIFRHCPCSLAFQQEKEKKKTQAKADTAEKENPPADVIERENSAKSADANFGRGEKRPNAPIQGDTPADNIMPLQTFIRPIKVLRNLSPQGSPRPAEHPSSSHSVRAVQLATTSSTVPETQPSTLEKGIGAQAMAPVGEDESAEANTTGYPEEVSTESHETIPIPDDQALEHVAELTKEDFPHVSNSQIGESSSFVPAEITMNPSAEDLSDDIFDFLDQWDASISSAEAFTCLATSSTTTGALPDYGAEALLRSYKDGDLISLEDKDERNKLKAAIETLASFGFFPDPRSAAMITYLFGQVEKFAPRRRSFLEEQRIAQDLEQRITSCSATMRKKIEIARQMQHEAADIDEKVRQLQEKKAGIIAKVSEIVRSNRPLEAQLRQDVAAVGEYRERKLMIQSTLSAGDTTMKSFRTAIRTLFPDA
ncbi:hypothetical protein L3X38_040063 [Prunus dulcis]|uniref:RDRP3-5 N-terminal domain-containing protein n=1 Tax=Prunus dulcis TaxID=3755 RepID=A0AAD4V8C1_PRUDU|nr:hypothetical protein L3X38_040063 [Prunus dulcis]